MDNYTNVGASATEQDASTGASASVDVSQQNCTDTDAAKAPSPLETTVGTGKFGNIVVFLDHDAGSYIWPFQRCRTFEMAKALIEEIYMSRHDEHYAEVRSGEYDLHISDVEHEIEDGPIILPSLWNMIVRPFMTIRLALRINEGDSENGTSTSDSDRDLDAMGLKPLGPGRGSERVDHNVEHQNDIDGSDAPLGDATQSVQSDNDGSSGSSGTDSPVDEDEQIPGPTRVVVPPTDAEGNKLSFGVDTSRTTMPLRAPRAPGTSDAANPIVGEQGDQSKPEVEVRRITKALMVDSDGKSTIHIHDLPGPSNPQVRDSTSITWYHLKAGQLDFSRFRDTCLGVPGLSVRMQILLGELLDRIDKHKIKRYFGGYFIEPGTVLRADEKCQPDPHSIIFTCVPYLDLQPTAQMASKTTTRPFPARSLMQALYPDEGVRERDAEQAYRKFRADKSKDLVYVPNLWMMNIGSTIVVTCGHKSLKEELINSIEIVHEDLKQLQSTDITNSTLTNIRLEDRKGRVHLYSLIACRSYFQLEQKINELTRSPYSENDGMLEAVTLFAPVGDRPILPMAWVAKDGERLLLPGDWPAIVRRTDLIFIDIILLDTKEFSKLYDNASAAVDISTPLPALQSSDLVLPFFHWPAGGNADPGVPSRQSTNSRSSDDELVSERLEAADKSMMTETLIIKETRIDIEKAFASTAFYKGLPEVTSTHVIAQFDSLKSTPPPNDTHSWHDEIIARHCSTAVARSARFSNIVHTTLCLFARDTDCSKILRKVWGALDHVHEIIAQAQTLGAVKPDPANDTSTNSDRRAGRWYVREAKAETVPETEVNEKFRRSVKRCRRCLSSKPFGSVDAATEHLRVHLAEFSLPTPARGGSGSANQDPFPSQTPEVDLKDWTIHERQLRREEWSNHIVRVLTQACTHSFALLLQAKDLADGVQDEDMRFLELYSFPRRLIDAFSSIIVYYLAVERALHQAKTPLQEDDLTYGLQTPIVLETLGRFYTDARDSLTAIRWDLCNMSKSSSPPDIMQSLSLGTPYICGWLMRRLIVKSLEGHLTVGEMYWDYLSKIQFRVNHRPGKRLIRSINLLQEELQGLLRVNSWQTRLTQNYARVLDDSTYEKDTPSRKAMFPYERMLFRSCLDNLAQQEDIYRSLLLRCNPLSDRTKQSLEINEEDHGKAIMVFTVVTIIFLPLSFVTSYFGMNTTDIRDMGSGQSLFWAVALPLTAVTMGTALFIGYNGDELRDTFSSLFHPNGAFAKSEFKGGQLSQRDSSSSLDDTSLADNAEYASPRLEYNMENWDQAGYRDEWDEKLDFELPQTREDIMIQRPRQSRHVVVSTTRPAPPPPRPRYNTPYLSQPRHGRTRLDQWDYEDEWYTRGARHVPNTGRHYANRHGRGDDGYDPQLRTAPRVAIYNNNGDDEADEWHNNRNAPGRNQRDNGAQGYTWVKKRKGRRTEGPGGSRRGFAVDDDMYGNRSHRTT